MTVQSNDLTGGPAELALTRRTALPTGGAVPSGLTDDFSVRHRGEVAVVSLRGDLDVTGAWRVRTRPLYAASSPPPAC
jgi:hypothetical protein